MAAQRRHFRIRRQGLGGRREVIGVRFAAEPAGEQAVLPPGVQVREEHGDRLADEPAPVDDDADPAQRQASMLKIEQLAGGQVNRDLVVVLFPAGRRAFTRDDWLGGDGAQKLCNPGDTYPA